jgi:hypothetical protein
MEFLIHRIIVYLSEDGMKALDSVALGETHHSEDIRCVHSTSHLGIFVSQAHESYLNGCLYFILERKLLSFSVC